MEDINIKITDKTNCFAVIINEGEDVELIIKGSEREIAAAILTGMDENKDVKALIEKTALIYSFHHLKEMDKNNRKNNA